jgi:hypothetical protein
MEHRPHIIERAYQIAAECGSLDQVRHRLIREGYLHVEAHLQGPQIKRDLTSRLHPELRALAKDKSLNGRKPATD